MKKHFLVRNIPSAITLLNLLCGFTAVLAVFTNRLYLSAILILLACIFDVLDGLVARSFNLTSDFGFELDSLTDAVSFVVAPAVLVYAKYLASSLTILVVLFMVIAGIVRLAKFNTIHYNKSFIGIPTPAIAMIASLFVLSDTVLPKILVAAIFFVLAALMVSPFRVPNLKDKAFLRYKIGGVCIMFVLFMALLINLDIIYILVIEYLSAIILMIVPLYFSKLVRRKSYMLVFIIGLVISSASFYRDWNFLVVLLPLYVVIASPLVQASFEGKGVKT